MWNIKNKEAVSPVIGVILMVAITVVLAAVLYVWVSGFMTSTTGGVYALSTGTWTDGGSLMNASVISTTPNTGIKSSDITWQLYNVSSGQATTVTVTVYSSGTTTDTTVKAGYRLQCAATEGAEYKVRAIVGGSQIYESAAFTMVA